VLEKRPSKAVQSDTAVDTIDRKYACTKKAVERTTCCFHAPWRFAVANAGVLVAVNLHTQDVQLAADGTRKLVSALTSGEGAGKKVETVIIPMLR